MSFQLKKICNMCGGSGFTKVLDLGEMPPANAFLKEEDLHKEQSFPLAVQLCCNCKSLQLCHVVSPELLFQNYHYVTSASRPLVEHFNVLADEIAESYVKDPQDLVLEIGSNDGSLLARIKDRCRVLGVDPADNIAELALANGVPTKVGFFGTDFAQDIKNETGEAAVVVANNVLAHIDNLRDVFQGINSLLSDTGIVIFEVHWVGNLLTDGGFDQIYHEHIYYHSLHSIQHLLNSIGMIVKDVKLVPIHGASMRIYAGKQGEVSPNVAEFLKKEAEMGLTQEETYLKFSSKVEANKKSLLETLRKLKEAGKRIVGYGAPAKGNTLLNYFNIGPETLDYITDTTPAKQGTYTPGSHILVVSPERLKQDRPDYVVLLSWNYADAILNKEKELRESGVQFIIPVPEVRIV